jgi:hypothetical protein
MKAMINKFFDKYSIENLTIYMVVLTALVSGANRLLGIHAGSISYETLIRGEIWNLIFFPFAVGGRGWSFALYLYIFWIFGVALEHTIGKAQYNKYIFVGLILIITGGILFPGQVDSVNLYLSIFLATAYLTPDQEILLFFILPVKIKWLAIMTVALVVGRTIILILQTGNPLFIFGPLFGFGNFLIFYVPQLVRRIRGAARSTREVRRLQGDTETPFHSCNVCGKTEKSNPELDFRYCIECDQEFCMEHLKNHSHN